MGIHGLLPQLRSIMVPTNVEELRGRRVAVDTYSWLHKGALSCSTHLCKGLATSKHIDYCMHRVNLLRHYGIKPILVFDGGLLPMKTDQETKRARARKDNLERAMEHEASGNSTAAFGCYQKAVDISPSIAYELIQVLKQEKVDYIVAPYEADAQMTFLSINKHVDAVITEDSDLIPFGCSRIIFKMDKFGQAVEFKSSDLEKNKELDFTGFTKTMLLEMCIFSGCDYLQSLPGMGLKRAHALVQKFKSHEKVIKHLRYAAVSIPPSFEDSFKKAMWAFQHQRVYDPLKEDIVHLSDIPHDLGHDLDFLGPWLPQDVVKGIAKGDLDPFTKLPFEERVTCMTSIHSKTYTEQEFAPTNGRKRLDLPVQKNILTNYFCLASLEAKRKFRAPKVIPKHLVTAESSSPSSEDHAHDLPGSSDEAVTPILNDSQESLLNSGNFSDEPPSVDLNADKPSSQSNKINGLSSYSYSPGVLSASKCSSSSLELRRETLKSVLSLGKESNCKPAIGVSENNGNLTQRKVIVKSCYFRNVLDENTHENQNEEHAADEEDASGSAYDHHTSKVASAGTDCPKSAIKKRKLINGTVPSKNSSTASPLETGDDFPNLTNRGENMKIEGNFGCNISHLNSYAGIAEKSMDRFVSLMSSFRYTGSRASGLRAPLKDVQNTCSARSISAPTKFSKDSHAQ